MTRSVLLAGLLAVAAWPVHAADDSLLAAKRLAEASPRPATVARSEFMQRAAVRDFSMSPDGNWLAYRRDVGARVELRIRKFTTGDDKRVVADSEGTELRWSGDSARLWLVDAAGIGVFDIAALTGKRIFRFDERRQQQYWLTDANAPGVVLVREKVPAGGNWLYRYLAVDASGASQVVHESRQALQSALLDADGQLAYSSGYDGAEFDTVIRRHRHDDGGDDILMRCPLPQQCRPVAYHGDRVWALAHHGNDLMALQAYTAESGWQILATDPRGLSDAVSVLMQPDGRDWFAVAFRPDRVAWLGRDDAARKQLAALQLHLPAGDLDIMPADNGKRWLVQAGRADWQYERCYLYETSTDTLLPLFADERIAPVPATQLAKSVALHWRNADGVLLHGYAFLPRGVDLAKAPVIALVHGGPYNRSNGGMDVGSQLLANRGYVVFKPNFRASTGYGLRYVKGTGGNFGKAGGALDDIVSGLDHLIANGVGDPQRQGIVGHSFGGYASLLAVTHHPGRFAFAVPSAAPVDMAWTMQDIAIEGGSALSMDGPPVEILFPAYGVPYGEPGWQAMMRRDSPLAHAADLHTPVYLWAGGRDDRVAVESLVRYTAEANPAFRPTLLIDPDAGHSPGGRLNSEALAWLIEDAANRHFGGGVTPPSPELQAFLDRNLHRPAAVKPE